MKRPRIVEIGSSNDPERIVTTTAAGAQELLDVNVAAGNITFVASNAVNNALSFTGYNLAAAAFNQTTAVTGDYTLDHLEILFSSVEERTVLVTSVATGALLFAYVGPNANVEKSFDSKAYSSGSQINVSVTQTTGACTMNLRLATFIGTNALAPVTTTVNQGNAGSQAWPVQIGTAGPNSVTNPVYVAGGFVKDTNNSTTATLLAGATFTGTATDISGYSALTYNLFASPDQMATSSVLTFEFSTDGTNWDVQVPATLGDTSIFIPVPLRPVMQYFRIVYVNGSVNQTVMRLTTYLHRTIPDPLVRTLSQTPQDDDPADFVRAFIEPSFQGQELLISADRAMDGSANVLPFIAQDKWQFDVPFANNNIKVVQAGSATATQAASTGAKLTSNNAAGASSAQLLGQKKNRYSPTYEVRQIGSMVFPAAGLANSRVMMGLTDQVVVGSTTQIDPTLGNGLFVGYIGTVFGFHIITGGVTTTIARSAWNGDIALSGGATASNGLLGLSAFRKNNKPIEWDLTQGWAFRIRYKYFGVAFMRLEVESPDGNWVAAHTQRGPFGAVPNIQNPNLFLFEEVTKLAGSGTGTLVAQSFSNSCGTVTPEIFFEKHEVNGHKQVQQAITNNTGNVAPVYTVSAGRQLLITSFWANLLTVSQAAGNRLEIRDGGIAGTLLYALTAQRANNNMITQTSSFDTPLVFLTDVTAVLVVAGGSMVYDLGFTGFEKEL